MSVRTGFLQEPKNRKPQQLRRKSVCVDEKEMVECRDGVSLNREEDGEKEGGTDSWAVLVSDDRRSTQQGGYITGSDRWGTVVAGGRTNGKVGGWVGNQNIIAH